MKTQKRIEQICQHLTECGVSNIEVNPKQGYTHIVSRYKTDEFKWDYFEIKGEVRGIPVLVEVSENKKAQKLGLSDNIKIGNKEMKYINDMEIHIHL